MRVFGIFVSGVLACFFFWNLSSAPTPPEKDRLLLEILNYVLERGHYDPKVIDDAFSENAFQSYLEGLDGQHRFFLQTDINTFKRYRYRIDDEFKASALNFFNVTYERLLSRMTQVENFYPQLLEAPFDFSKPDQISLDYENLPYANSVTQLKSRWRKRLKLSVLDRFSDKKKEEKEKFESDSTYVMKSDVELEKEARKLTWKILVIILTWSKTWIVRIGFQCISMPLSCSLIHTLFTLHPKKKIDLTPVCLENLKGLERVCKNEIKK